MDENDDRCVDAGRARDLMIEAAQEAGALAMAFFRAGERTGAHVSYKPGGSPVTEADLAVDAFLRARLGASFACAGWLSEESEDDGGRLRHSRVVIVDPIDGTRGFMDGDPRWAVSIALVVAGRPVAGVIHAPALAETYAAAKGLGSTMNGVAIEVSGLEALGGARIAGPRHLVDAIARVGALSLMAQRKIPSLAYRLALVASGALDLALASKDSHDWDIAAADLLLAEAGGRLVDADGQLLHYNKAETRRGVLFAASARLTDPFVAAGRLACAGD